LIHPSADPVLTAAIHPDPESGFYPRRPHELPVMEAFYTLQGEGRYTGHAAWFIRLAGCSVGCTWCDVKESWELRENQYRKIIEIVQDACQSPARLAVITGGEPCMHHLEELTRELKDKGFRAHLETSGCWPVTGAFDWICVSPKKFKKPLDETMKRADELKVVVYHSSDLEWAIHQAEKTSPGCLLYLQPEHSRLNAILPKVLEFIGEHPQWQLSLQTHKFIGIP
jgi:organic radical activating enzyme